MADNRFHFIPAGPISDAAEAAFNWAGVDGAHHKQWCITTMLRCLLTCSQYEDFCEAWGSVNGQSWDEGIAP